MRIAILSQDDPVYILPFFDEFVRNYSEEFEILQVTCCRVMGKRPRLQLAREMRLLYGTAGFLKIGFQVILSKVLGTYPRPKTATNFYSIRQLCKAYGIPYETIENPNSEEYIQRLRDHAPDVLLSVACPHILKRPVLDVPPQGCINIHHAPLPRYKGMMPTFWQMFHHERAVGVSVHYMVPKVDEGPMLLQESMDIGVGETLHELIRRSKRHGAHCVAKTLRMLNNHSAVPFRPSGEPSYFTFPTPQQITEFAKNGLRAI